MNYETAKTVKQTRLDDFKKAYAALDLATALLADIWSDVAGGDDDSDAAIDLETLALDVEAVRDNLESFLDGLPGDLPSLTFAQPLRQIGLFHTPADWAELNDWILAHNGGERVAAVTAAAMAWNLSAVESRKGAF